MSTSKCIYIPGVFIGSTGAEQECSRCEHMFPLSGTADYVRVDNPRASFHYESSYCFECAKIAHPKLWKKFTKNGMYQVALQARLGVNIDNLQEKYYDRLDAFVRGGCSGDW